MSGGAAVRNGTNGASAAPVPGRFLAERRAPSRAPAGPDAREEMRRLLLGRYTPAAVLVDDSFHMMHAHGGVGAFLRAPRGPGSADLMRLVKGELAAAVRAAVLKARSLDAPVVRRVRWSSDRSAPAATVEAVPVRCAGERRRRYLVLFRREGAPPGRADGGEELAAAQEDLREVNAELTALIEELRRKNAVLNAANDDLSNLLASSQIPIVMLDRRLRVRRFNRPAESALGLADDDVGRPAAGLRLAVDLLPLKPAMRDVVGGGEARQYEVRDRRGRWYSLWIRPYKTRAGVVDGAVLSMVDVTEKRAAMRALESARDYAEAIVDTVNDSLLILDRHLKVRSASRFYYELFRESPGDVEGRSIYELSEGLWTAPALRRQLSALASAGTPFSGWEADFDVPRLGRRTLTVSGRMVPRDADAEPRIVVAIEDVSPRKQAAEAAALRKSEARQREFVANVTHELMTPITAIKGYAESLIGGALDSPSKRLRFTQTIEHNADRLGQLVEDLLQLSSYDAGRARRAVESVPLKAAVERQVRALAPAFRARGLTVRVQIPAGLRAAAHRGELAQVLQNLCENAVKYNRPKGRVWVRARRAGKRVIVSVQDTGIGVPKEDLPRIFDRFHRAANARARTERGNGLGLSIVRSILSGRGCRVWAESAEGKGTVVSFTLPAAEPRRR